MRRTAVLASQRSMDAIRRRSGSPVPGRGNHTASSFSKQHFDASIDQTFVDVADGIGILCHDFFDFGAVRRFFGGTAPSSENNFRPVGFYLRGGLARDFRIKLVA